MIPRPVAFVVHPGAGAGRGQRWLDGHRRAIEKALPDSTFLLTRGAGDERDRALEAARTGARLVVAVTGDGGLATVVEGIQAAGTGAALGIVRAGTGGDFGRVLGLPRSDRWDLEAFLQGERRPIDLIEARFTGPEGGSERRLVVNIASFGISGHVVRTVNDSSKRGGGFLSFFFASLRALVTYRNQEVHLRADGRDLGRRKVFNVALANGRAFGGGMLIAPRARLDDGFLELVVLSNRGLFQSLRLAPALYRGRHLDQPWTEHLQVQQFEAHADAPVLLELDGEQVGQLPASLRILPGAIDLWTGHPRVSPLPGEPGSISLS